MADPVRVDAVVDLAYGALILLSILLIATGQTNAGIAFGVGVFASYVVHVVWKMARFDPDWMTKTVQETVEETVDDAMGDAVEETVGETVEETVGETVQKTVERSVGETVSEVVEESVEERLEEVEAQVEAVDERVDRRPREDEVEALLEGEQAAGDDGADRDGG